MVCRAVLTQAAMLHLPSLLQTVLLAIVAAVSCVHGLRLQDPSTELRLDAEEVLSVGTDLQDVDLREARRSLLGKKKKKASPVAIAISDATSKALAGKGGTAIADSVADAKAKAGKGGTAIADSTADSLAKAGKGGTAIADAKANSKAKAGKGGTAIASSTATSTAVAK